MSSREAFLDSFGYSYSLQALYEGIGGDSLLLAGVHITEDDGTVNKLLLANNDDMLHTTGFRITELGREGIVREVLHDRDTSLTELIDDHETAYLWSKTKLNDVRAWSFDFGTGDATRRWSFAQDSNGTNATGLALRLSFEEGIKPSTTDNEGSTFAFVAAIK